MKRKQTVSARHYLGDRGVDVTHARFVGPYVAARLEPESKELVSAAGFRIWHPPSGARQYDFWTRCMSPEPQDTAWTMQTRTGWKYCVGSDYPGKRDFAGTFKSEVAALKAAAVEMKRRGEELDQQINQGITR